MTAQAHAQAHEVPAQAEQKPQPQLDTSTSNAYLAELAELTFDGDPAALLDTSAVTQAAFGFGDWWSGEDDDDRDMSDVVGDMRSAVREQLAVDTAEKLGGKSEAERAAAIEKLTPKQLENLMEDLPADRQRELLEPLIQVAGNPEKRVQLWKTYHKASTREQVAAKLGTLDLSTPEGVAESLALTRAMMGELTEADEEAAHLLADPKVDDKAVEDMMARKKREVEIEVKWGINLTNDTGTSTAEPRSRRVWEATDLDWFENELPKIPAKHRHDVTEFRRASEGWRMDPKTKKWKRSSAMAQHHPGSGVIEMFDAGMGAPGSLIHEIGHNVDKNNPEAMAKFEANLKFERHKNQGAVEAEIASKGSKLSATQIKAKLDAAKAGKSVGAHRQRGVEIDGRLYQVDGDGNWTSYDAGALPTRDVTENTTGGWDDEWDYARTGPADAFADTYKLMARDPVRAYQDMIEGPKAKVEALKASGASSTEVAEAQRKVDLLQDQWDLVRGEVNGLNNSDVEAAAATLPGTKGILFKQQAARCATPAQLEALRSAWMNGEQVDAYARAEASAIVPKGQAKAFWEDAKGCFTKDQLEKLAKAYKDGKRKDAEWDRGLKGEETLLGT